MHYFMRWRIVGYLISTAKKICLLFSLSSFLGLTANFVNAWNRHPLHTENGLTPLQLWNRGLLSASPLWQNEIAQGLTVSDDYGVESYTQATVCFDQGTVAVPEIELDMSDQELEYLRGHYNPLQRSDCNGVDIYIQVKDYCVCYRFYICML